MKDWKDVLYEKIKDEPIDLIKDKTMNKKVPSKISFQHWGEKVTIEREDSDIPIEEFHRMCRQLALAAGFAESIVNEYFEQL
tara:strand:- start:714 stop:959 length:246 start_codon:yes stop_codon:yes gene_type:complete